MGRPLLGVMTLALLSASIERALATDPGRDEAEIRDVQKRQAETWNRHDARAYAGLFAEDADVVNVLGWWWKGRPEVESKLTAALPEPRQGIQTQVLRKESGRWLIAAFQNTNGVPEQPFPTGPPVAPPTATAGP